MFETMSYSLPALTVGILLSPDLERRLRAAEARIRFEARSDLLDLAFFDLEAKPFAFIVGSWVIASRCEVDMVRRLGARRGAPVILYARMSPELAPTLLQLGQAGIRHVMLYGVDDTPERVRKILVEASSACIRPGRS